MSNEPRSNRHSVYKRLETDAEFRKRLREEHNLNMSTLSTSAELDGWMRKEIGKWKSIADAAHIKVD